MHKLSQIVNQGHKAEQLLKLAELIEILKTTAHLDKEIRIDDHRIAVVCDIHSTKYFPLTCFEIGPRLKTILAEKLQEIYSEEITKLGLSEE